jgi:hypothetical protein
LSRDVRGAPPVGDGAARSVEEARRGVECGLVDDPGLVAMAAAAAEAEVTNALEADAEGSANESNATAAAVPADGRATTGPRGLLCLLLLPLLPTPPIGTPPPLSACELCAASSAAVSFSFSKLSSALLCRECTRDSGRDAAGL